MKRRMVGSAVVAVGSALLVAGCAAGQITQTDTQVAAINGASTEVGEIAIQNAELAYPEGNASGDSGGAGGAGVYPQNSDAEAVIWLINEGGQDDELVSAETDAAQNVTIGGSRVVPAQRMLVLSPEKEGTGNPNHGQLTLEGLTEQLIPGQMIEITLTFREAGSVTFDMPVAVPEEPRTNPASPAEGAGGGN